MKRTPAIVSKFDDEKIAIVMIRCHGLAT
jgi:hypothetical protein